MMTHQTVPFLNFYGSRGGGIINYHALLYTFMITQQIVPFLIFYGSRGGGGVRGLLIIIHFYEDLTNCAILDLLW